MVEVEPKLTVQQQTRLHKLHNELVAHDAEAERQRDAILRRMGLAAADIHGDHPGYTKGLNAEIAAALQVSRNHVYRLMELATGERKSRRKTTHRPTVGSGPEFRSAGQQAPPES